MANNADKKRNGSTNSRNVEKKEAGDKFKKQDFLMTNLDHKSIEVIMKFMEHYVKDITTSQLRNVYSVILDSQLGNPSKRVKIAYIAARNNKGGMQILLQKLDDMLHADGNYETIRNFTEACVAYHKYYDTLKNNY